MNNPCEACRFIKGVDDWHCYDPTGPQWTASSKEPVENEAHCSLFQRWLGYQEGLAEKDWEWRSLLWAGHGCATVGLYGDDGELQCNNVGCMLDFKRDTPKKIVHSISHRGLAEAESRVKAREQYGLLLTEQTCEVCGEKFFGLHDCSKAYAKGFQDGSKAREREIVEWLRDEAEKQSLAGTQMPEAEHRHLKKEVVIGLAETIRRLESWLGKE